MLPVCLVSVLPTTHGLNADQLRATEVRVSHVIHNVNFMLSETVWQLLALFTSANQSGGATCLRERQFNGVTVNQRVRCEETMLGSLCLSRTDIYLFTAEHVHGTNKMSHLISTLRLFEMQRIS